MLALGSDVNLERVLDAAAGLNPIICRELGNHVFAGLRKKNPWVIHRSGGSTSRLRIVGPGQTPKHKYASTTIVSMHMSLYIPADQRLGVPEMALSFERGHYWAALDELNDRERTGWYRALDEDWLRVLWYRSTDARGAYLRANPDAPKHAPAACEAIGRALAISGDFRRL